MLTASQRKRIVSHLERGWKLPDSLAQELWEAYEALEQNHNAQQRPRAAGSVHLVQGSASADPLNAERP